MKTLSLVPLCVAATLFILPLARAVDATSDPAASAVTPDKKAARQAEILKRFDTNGDGKLDDTERAAAKAAMHKDRTAGATKIHQRMLQRFDKNGDGVLDDSERSAALVELETRPRFVKRFDKDGDGKLNAEEKSAADQWLRQQFGPKQN